MKACSTSKNAWSPGRIMRSVKLCGCGLQRSPEIALMASTSSEPCSYKNLVALAHAGLELLADQLIDAVHHGGGAVEQRDLVDALDLARVEHDLLAVGDFQSRALELEQHRRFDDVDAERHAGDAGLAQQARDLLGVAAHQAERRRHGAAQADEAGLAQLRAEPGHVEPVVDRGRAEVPQIGRASC